MTRIILLLALLCGSLPALAAPRVVASIPPLHSLASGVMEGVGEPQLLIGGGASPHDYALKPSDARALAEAQLILWVGEGLEAVLEKPLHSLAGKARVVELGALEGMELLPTREGGVWEGHAGEEAEEGPDDGHDEGHRHGEFDNHLWLSPHNARRTVAALAEALAQLDPANAARYRANAEGLAARITALENELKLRLSPLRERRYIVFHDAYHYFEAAFGLQPAGAIAVSPDRRPGARRIGEIRRTIRVSGAACVFSEPQFRSAIVEVVLEGTEARHGVLDPLGSALSPGAGQWFALMRGLADDLEACLSAR
ncbi:MAG TPA: zinc ABC transporter substrate-binding protein [Gammaproteobacteria bacterium]|jgi:zinc transport system substrate-binding protein